MRNKVYIEQTHLSNDFTNTDKSNLDTAFTNNHTHSNKTLLDSIISSGDGNSYLANDGTYKGVSVNKSIIQIGSCATASATAEKAVTLSGFSLATGSIILVKFTNANTVGVPTLNVNSTGAKAIYSEAGTAVSATNPAYFPAGAIVEFIYDGINWIFKKRLVQNYVNGTSWYRIYSDGWIEQGGKVTVIGGGTTVTLLKSFSDTNYAVLATAFNATCATCNFQSSTTLKITAANVGDVVFWEAKGY